MTRRRLALPAALRSPLAPYAALLGVLLLPGHPLSFVRGLPWGPLALSCAILLGIGLFAAYPLPRTRWAAPLTVAIVGLGLLKLGLALVAPRYGFEASYFANDRLRGEVEGSILFIGAPYTRIDPWLDFGGDEFPLYFFNDADRFNTLGPDRLNRGRSLVWSARWLGYLNVDHPRPVTIRLTASGPGQLALDGKPLLAVDAAGRATAEATVQLEPGPHLLEVRYVRERDRSGLLRVTTDLDGQQRPLGPPYATAAPYRPERLALDRWLTRAAQAVDGVYLALLTAVLAWGVLSRVWAPAATGLSRWCHLERPLLAGVLLVFLLHAVLPRLDRYEKMVFLGGGQDWLTHETLARDIIFNGPLMTQGEPLGHGAPYYAQPFYPYFLALLHLLTGEDLFGVVTLQIFGLGVVALLVYTLARQTLGLPSALAALALTVGLLIPFELAWVVHYLLSEALYFWLMPAAILALLAATRRPRPTWVVLAGLLLGLACVTRSPTLLYLPPAGLLAWRLLRRRGLTRAGAGYALALGGLCAAALIGLVPLRNVIVTGRPTLVAASGGVNLEKFHRPSDRVQLGRIDEDPLQQWLDVDRPTREVIEYLRQDPVGYFASYLPLAAYTLGIGSAMNDLLPEQPVQLHPVLLLLDALYLLALLLVPRARTAEAGLLHAFIGVHFLTMVIFTPYDYENRLVLPMYVVVTVFAGAALARLLAVVATFALARAGLPIAKLIGRTAQPAEADAPPRERSPSPR